MKLKPWFLLPILLAASANKPNAADMPALSFERKVRNTQNPTGKGFEWKTIEAADYRQYVANLRSIGCPAKTIQDIIISEIHDLYEAKESELNPRTQDDYWKASGGIFGFTMKPETPELGLKRFELQWERRRLLVALLGMAPEDSYTLGFHLLSNEKKFKAADIVQAVYRKRIIASGTTRIPITPELHLEVEAALAKLLTSEEMFRYEMESSSIANWMRAELASFEPTEKEFVAIYKIRKPIWQKYPDTTVVPTDRNAALLAADEGLRTMLGESRYREYKRCQDYNFSKWYPIATSQGGLNRDAALKFCDLMIEADKKAYAIRAGSMHVGKDTKEALSREAMETRSKEVKAALKKLRQETEKSIQSLFGENYGAFKKNPFSYNQVEFSLRMISPD